MPGCLVPLARLAVDLQGWGTFASAVLAMAFIFGDSVKGVFEVWLSCSFMCAHAPRFSSQWHSIRLLLSILDNLACLRLALTCASCNATFASTKPTIVLYMHLV